MRLVRCQGLLRWKERQESYYGLNWFRWARHLFLSHLHDFLDCDKARKMYDKKKLYQALQVPKTATAAEIKQAFRKLSLLCRFFVLWENLPSMLHTAKLQSISSPKWYSTTSQVLLPPRWCSRTSQVFLPPSWYITTSQVSIPPRWYSTTSQVSLPSSWYLK